MFYRNWVFSFEKGTNFRPLIGKSWLDIRGESLHHSIPKLGDDFIPLFPFVRQTYDRFHYVVGRILVFLVPGRVLGRLGGAVALLGLLYLRHHGHVLSGFGGVVDLLGLL